MRLTLFHQTRAVKTKRTCIVRRSAEPCYNESFHFRLEAAAIDATNIVLAIHQPDNKGNSSASKCRSVTSPRHLWVQPCAPSRTTMGQSHLSLLVSLDNKIV